MLVSLFVGKMTTAAKTRQKVAPHRSLDLADTFHFQCKHGLVRAHGCCRGRVFSFFLDGKITTSNSPFLYLAPQILNCQSCEIGATRIAVVGVQTGQNGSVSFVQARPFLSANFGVCNSEIESMSRIGVPSFAVSQRKRYICRFWVNTFRTSTCLM